MNNYFEEFKNSTQYIIIKYFSNLDKSIKEIFNKEKVKASNLILDTIDKNQNSCVVYFHNNLNNYIMHIIVLDDSIEGDDVKTIDISLTSDSNIEGENAEELEKNLTINKEELNADFFINVVNEETNA